MMLRATCCFLLLSASLACAAAQEVGPEHAARMKASQQLFRRQVKTILRASCLKCHGGESVQGDFDLSRRESLLESGYIDLDDPESSHLLAVVRHESEPKMPKKAAKLSEKSIAAIAKWVELGAAYDRPLSGDDSNSNPAGILEEAREFWAFRPLGGDNVPQIDDATIVNDIDRFLRAAQAERGLSPNAEADRRVLIRRATFDLTGLPPTPAEVRAFVQDTDPQAYERLVDRLLDSPHFGERWARHWMDVARFAESHGYEQDYDRPHAYHYRDFLIRAINDDLPFDKFVAWQLAGDELAPDDPLAMMATGFMGAGVFPTQLTEAEFESTRYDELDDIVATTGVAFLGLSIGCARCHDHKYDPIPTHDYYRLAAVFTKTIRSEIDLEVDPAANDKARREHDQALADLEAKIAGYDDAKQTAEYTEWLSAYSAEKATLWRRGKIVELTSSAGTKYEVDETQAALATGKAPDSETVTVRFEAVPEKVAAIRIEALRHDSLPRGGPGRAGNGNFVLGDVRVEAVDSEGELVAATLRNPRATHQQNTGDLSIAASIDDKPVTGWAVDRGGIGKDQAAVFDMEGGIQGAKGLVVTMRFEHPNRQHLLGRFRITFAAEAGLPAKVGDIGPAPATLALLAKAQLGKASADEQASARQWFLKHVSPLASWQRRLEALRATGPKLVTTKVQVSSEGFPHMKHHADGRGYPHFYAETYQLKRGDVHQKGDVAEPGYLQVLMRNGTDASTWAVEAPAGWDRTSMQRAALANWLTDHEKGAGHLVARVAVNRLWQHHFGRGLVATPNDFGFQGETPTHPELLDYLARQLIEHNWKMKPIHRLIMTSAAYRQSSVGQQRHQTLDPDNRLWARRVPRRLEAEAVRDAVLAAAGQLDKTMYGKGTLDGNMKRRSVYFFIKRSKLIPEMMLFDWPESLVSIGQRASTTTAPQALMFMNGPIVRQAAVAMAEQSGDVDNSQFVRDVYQRALGREPNAQEQQRAEEFLAVQSAARRAAGQGDELLVRADLCQVVFSLNEFMFID